MVGVFDLWLPILLSAVFVFIVSTVIHMVLRYHKGDYKKLPGEDTVLEAMRSQKLERGSYAFPHAASMKDMGSPEMLEKYKQGPVGYMTIGPNGPPAMGKGLALWFLFSVLMGVFAGYLAGMFLGPGADYHSVFRATGTAAILGYSASSLIDSVWKGQAWSVTLKHVFDGIMYALVTAGTFGWLWPA